MSKIARRMVRACLALGLLAGVSAAGATSASAASPNYGCTAQYPEICLGVYYSTDSFGDVSVTHEQIQANLDHNLYYRYTLYTPNGGQYTTVTYHSTASGWQTPPWKPTYTQIGTYRAVVQYGPTTQLLGGQSDEIVVTVL